MTRLDITLLFPDDTSVRISGDEERVLKLLRVAGDDMKGFIKHDLVVYDEASHWDLKALEKLLSKGRDDEKTRT